LQPAERATNSQWLRGRLADWWHPTLPVKNWQHVETGGQDVRAPVATIPGKVLAIFVECASAA
jgi:hypothetical protein